MTQAVLGVRFCGFEVQGLWTRLWDFGFRGNVAEQGKRLRSGVRGLGRESATAPQEIGRSLSRASHLPRSASTAYELMPVSKGQK